MNDAPPVLVLRGLEGHSQPTFSALQQSLAPHLHSIESFWFILWWAVLTYVVVNHLLVPNLLKEKRGI